MSNIREVARIAGVSVATVSRALSNPEKVSEASIKKVKDAIAKVNYRPNMLARNFRSARSYTIVVMVPNISNPFFGNIIRSVELQAQKMGYSVLLGNTQDIQDREREYVKLAETRLAEGIIQLRPFQDEDPILHGASFPYLYLCTTEATPGPCVRIDNVAAIQHVVEHLLKLNHRRIGLITGPSDNPHTVDRFKGYRLGLEQAGIAFDPTLVAEGEYTTWTGADAANKLCDSDNRPTAIVCMNDEMAIGAIQALHSRGLRVPEDISVTGFDNIDYASYSDPPLTTVGQPTDNMGTLAVDLLMRLIQGGNLEKEKHIFPYEFVERQSTAAAPDTVIPANKK